MPLLSQFLVQFGVVLDNAVMHDGDHASAVGMGMGVDIVGATMCSPTCVTDAERADAGSLAVCDGLCQVGDFTSTTTQGEVSSVGTDSDACGVVAAIL